MSNIPATTKPSFLDRGSPTNTVAESGLRVGWQRFGQFDRGAQLPVRIASPEPSLELSAEFTAKASGPETIGGLSGSRWTCAQQFAHTDEQQ